MAAGRGKNWTPPALTSASSRMRSNVIVRLEGNNSGRLSVSQEITLGKKTGMLSVSQIGDGSRRAHFGHFDK